MNKSIAIFIFHIISCTLLFANEANSISKKTKLIIQTEALHVLTQYQNCINNIGNSAEENHEEAKSHIDKFLKLFINREVTIYNDLDPKKSLSDIYTAETYANNILLWYKHGITINLDFENAMILNLKQHSENIYTIDISIPKHTKGTYIDNSFIDNTENINFGIAFTLKDNEKPQNFKIARIKQQNTDQPIDQEILTDIDGEDIDDKEMQIIYNALNGLLNDYCNYLNLISSKDEIEDDIVFYKERFSSIFSNSDVLVVNDITKNTEADQISIGNYLSNFSSSFKQTNANVSFDIKNAKYGKAKKLEKHTYIIYVYLNKKIEYQGNKPFISETENSIKFEFLKKDDSYTDFKIQEISHKNMPVYRGKTIIDKAQTISTITRKGLNIDFNIGTGIHNYLNEDFENIPYKETIYSWDKQDNYGNFMAEINLSYYPYERTGFSIGIGYSPYKTKYNLNFEYKDDQNIYIGYSGHDQYDVIRTNYDSTISFRAFYIPIRCTMHSAKKWNTALYGNMGISVEFAQAVSYETMGNFILEGEYTDEHNNITTVSSDYVTGGIDKIVANSGTIHTFSRPSLNLNLGAGIEYDISYYTTITLGLYFSYGLNDLEKDKLTEKTIFDDNISHKSSHLKKQGITLGVRYKL